MSEPESTGTHSGLAVFEGVFSSELLDHLGRLSLASTKLPDGASALDGAAYEYGRQNLIIAMIEEAGNNDDFRRLIGDTEHPDPETVALLESLVAADALPADTVTALREVTDLVMEARRAMGASLTDKAELSGGRVEPAVNRAAKPGRSTVAEGTRADLVVRVGTADRGIDPAPVVGERIEQLRIEQLGISASEVEGAWGLVIDGVGSEETFVPMAAHKKNSKLSREDLSFIRCRIAESMFAAMQETRDESFLVATARKLFYDKNPHVTIGDFDMADFSNSIVYIVSRLQIAGSKLFVSGPSEGVHKGGRRINPRFDIGVIDFMGIPIEEQMASAALGENEDLGLLVPGVTVLVGTGHDSEQIVSVPADVVAATEVAISPLKEAEAAFGGADPTAAIVATSETNEQ